MQAAMRPVTPSRRYEKKREGLPTVHQAGLPSLPNAPTDAQGMQALARQTGQISEPLTGTQRGKAGQGVGAVLRECGAHFVTDLKGLRPDARPSHASTPLSAGADDAPG